MDATTNELALVVTATRMAEVVPLEAVDTIAAAHVRSRRYWTYVGVAGFLGALAVVLSNRFVPGALRTSAALGAAVALTVLLAGWVIPGLRRWLVVWRPVYQRDA